MWGLVGGMNAPEHVQATLQQRGQLLNGTDLA